MRVSREGLAFLSVWAKSKPQSKRMIQLPDAMQNRNFGVSCEGLYDMSYYLRKNPGITLVVCMLQIVA